MEHGHNTRLVCISPDNTKAIAFFEDLANSRAAAVKRMEERTAHIREAMIAEYKTKKDVHDDNWG